MNKTRFLRSPLLGTLLMVLGCIFSLKLAFLLYLSLDEFTYTHAAWLVSEGKIPYKDFPLFHPPFLEIALSGVFFITQSALSGMLVSRAIFGLLLFATALLVEREAKSKIGFVFALCLGVFSTWMTEIRPDSLALFLFLLANFALSKNHTLLSALIISLAVFSSEKTLVYAPALIIPLLIEKDFRNIFRLVLSSIIFSLLFYGILVAAAGWKPSYEFLVSWAIKHETFYPKRDPFLDLREYALQLLFLLILSLIAVRKRIRANVQWLVLLALGSASYFSQRGPYGYSLLPALLALVILASKGLERLVELRYLNWKPEIPLIIILFVFLIVAPQGEVTNQEQLKALSLADLLVPKNSCVYDNSGFIITKPHAEYWYFTDQLVRNTYMDQFETRVPMEMEEGRCVAMIKDERFVKLSKNLQTQLNELFPNCMGLICVNWKGKESSAFN